MSPISAEVGLMRRRASFPDEVPDAATARRSTQPRSHVIITFRLLADEFEEHRAHRQSCSGCGDLAHLYLAMADRVYVKIFIDHLGVHPVPDPAKLVEQLVKRETEIARRRRPVGVLEARRRLLRGLEHERDERVLKVIRAAWDRQEEQESQGLWPAPEFNGGNDEYHPRDTDRP